MKNFLLALLLIICWPIGLFLIINQALKNREAEEKARFAREEAKHAELLAALSK